MKIKVFDSELRIMEILWEHGEMNARQIAHILEDEIGWNVNTTYTTIKKLIAKNAVERRNPKFMCIPLVTKEEVQKQEVRELGRKLFDGSASALLSAFVADKKISKKEIDQMKKIVDLLEDEE
jgi:predicted transcriptional regulator